MWPTTHEDEQSFEMVMTAIKAVRARRSEMNVPPSRKAHLLIVTDRKAAFEAGRSYICKLAYAGEVSVLDEPPEGSESMVSVVTDNARMFMPMADLVDLDKERARIAKELANAEKQLAYAEKSRSTRAADRRERAAGESPCEAARKVGSEHAA